MSEDNRARVVRPRWVLLAVVALAALSVVGVVRVARSGGERSTAAVRQPTPTPPTVLNGRIFGVDPTRYLAAMPPACSRCFGNEVVSFDPRAGTALVARSTTYRPRTPAYARGITALHVIGPRGQVARLSCPKDFRCEPGAGHGPQAAGLGPGTDEITFESPAKQLQVIGFDGVTRDTIDLSAALADTETVKDLTWSPDDRRLLVLTWLRGDRRMWLVDRDGDRPQLVHTITPRRAPGAGSAYLSVRSFAWSPDSRKLAFMEEHNNFIHHNEVTVLSRVRSLLLPEPGQVGPAAATTLYDRARAVVWSPDGTRVAVMTATGLLELSAEDGSVLARHPKVFGMLVWPARRS